MYSLVIQVMQRDYKLSSYSLNVRPLPSILPERALPSRLSCTAAVLPPFLSCTPVLPLVLSPRGFVISEPTCARYTTSTAS